MDEVLIFGMIRLVTVTRIDVRNLTNYVDHISMVLYCEVIKSPH